MRLKITAVYRINGSSTQLKGVTPDIYIPNKDSYTPGGESEEEHALPWQSIKPIPHQTFAAINTILPALQSEYKQSNQHNPLMQNLLAITAWRKKQSDIPY